MARWIGAKRFGNHDNAFGFLRLVLAGLVIVAHTPELVDGNANRELLTKIFGTTTFGGLAVSGFFIISGFLITASYHKDRRPVSFFRKRVARIYPGFAVCSLVCVLVIGPMGGGTLTGSFKDAIVLPLMSILILCPPTVNGVFDGTNYPYLNGAAWTIQYEFLCYCLVMFLGWIGAFRFPALIAAGAFILLAICSIDPGHLSEWLNGLPRPDLLFQGDRFSVFRLTGFFLSGATFYLLQEKIVLSRIFAIGAAVATVILLFSSTLFNFGLAIFGSYLLFATAALCSGTFISRINNKNDISYGLYLYAFPIEKLLLWWQVSDNVIVLGGLTFALASAAGAISWRLVEKPMMRLVRPDRSNEPRPTTANSS